MGEGKIPGGGGKRQQHERRGAWSTKAGRPFSMCGGALCRGGISGAEALRRVWGRGSLRAGAEFLRGGAPPYSLGSDGRYPRSRHGELGHALAS